MEFTNLLRLGNEAFVSLLRKFGLKLKGLAERPHASELLEKGPRLIERLPGVVAIGVRDGSIANRDVFADAAGTTGELSLGKVPIGEFAVDVISALIASGASCN